MKTMTIDDVLESLTDSEAADLLRRIESDREWRAFFNGWTAAMGLVRDMNSVAHRLTLGADPDDFINDLKTAVAVILLRHGHDVSGLPSPDVLSEIGALVPEPVEAGLN